MSQTTKGVATSKTQNEKSVVKPVMKDYDFFRNGIMDIGRKIRLQDRTEELNARISSFMADISHDDKSEAVIVFQYRNKRIQLEDAELISEVIDFANSALTTQSESIKEEIIKATKGLN